jgi:hypothetical protein
VRAFFPAVAAAGRDQSSCPSLVQEPVAGRGAALIERVR